MKSCNWLFWSCDVCFNDFLRDPKTFVSRFAVFIRPIIRSKLCCCVILFHCFIRRKNFHCVRSILFYHWKVRNRSCRRFRSWWRQNSDRNGRITTREIVTRLNSSNSIVRDPVKRLDVPLSRKETKLLSEQSNKINVCSSKYQIFVSLERNCCTIQRFNHPYMIYLNSQFYSLELEF